MILISKDGPVGFIVDQRYIDVNVKHIIVNHFDFNDDAYFAVRSEPRKTPADPSFAVM